MWFVGLFFVPIGVIILVCSGGHSYLLEPCSWAGMLSMIIGEEANFAAYAFAPAELVTPLGALRMIVSALLAHFILKGRLHIFGMVGYCICLIGSVTIVLHTPLERSIQSVKDVWNLATPPGFLAYALTVLVLILILIVRFVPLYGHLHLVVYIGICSLADSLMVMGVKAIGMALTLTFGGQNQFKYFETWFFIVFVLNFCLLQLNYLKKALDTFNTAVVSPIYYVMFTTLTIVASMIMFKDYIHQNTTHIITGLCAFVIILGGTFLLHKTKDMGSNPSKPLPVVLPKTDKDCMQTSETTKVTAEV
ncbi:unnamed protein product [Withania somnifera]